MASWLVGLGSSESGPSVSPGIPRRCRLEESRPPVASHRTEASPSRRLFQKRGMTSPGALPMRYGESGRPQHVFLPKPCRNWFGPLPKKANHVPHCRSIQCTQTHIQAHAQRAYLLPPLAARQLFRPWRSSSARRDCQRQKTYTAPGRSPRRALPNGATREPGSSKAAVAYTSRARAGREVLAKPGDAGREGRVWVRAPNSSRAKRPDEMGSAALQTRGQAMAPVVFIISLS